MGDLSPGRQLVKFTATITRLYRFALCNCALSRRLDKRESTAMYAMEALSVAATILSYQEKGQSDQITGKQCNVTTPTKLELVSKKC